LLYRPLSATDVVGSGFTVTTVDIPEASLTSPGTVDWSNINLIVMKLESASVYGLSNFAIRGSLRHYGHGRAGAGCPPVLVQPSVRPQSMISFKRKKNDVLTARSEAIVPEHWPVY